MQERQEIFYYNFVLKKVKMAKATQGYIGYCLSFPLKKIRRVTYITVSWPSDSDSNEVAKYEGDSKSPRKSAAKLLVFMYRRKSE